MDKQSLILITGAGGFVGKNLTATLRQAGYENLALFEANDPPEALAEYARQAAFVFHLAGVNRPKDPGEFYTGNQGSADLLLQLLEQAGSAAPVLLTSSVQAELDNDYGKSKLAAEQAVFAHGRRTGAPVYVFRMEGVFGKWCRPNYNSVVATFCHNAARGLPLSVRDPAFELPLVYIDDVVACLLDALEGRPLLQDRSAEPICRIHPVHRVTLERLAELVEGFAAGRSALAAPYLAADSFEKKLYATFLSYLPPEEAVCPLAMHADARGSFTEFLRSPERGQMSVNVAKPGVVKGNHWHHTKSEKFLVVSGEAVIRLRRIDEETVHTFRVSGEKLEVVDMLPGYTHNIENVGQSDLVTLMWASEPFDPAHPDTYPLPV